MAGNDTAALVVALSAQVSKFEKDMQQANAIADKGMKQIENRFAAANQVIVDKFTGMAANAGLLGTVLQRLGPAGIGVAATIGTMAAAFSFASDKVDAFVEKAKATKEAAETTGLTITQFKLLGEAAKQAGVDSDQLEAFITRLTVAFDELRKTGGGPLFNDLARIDTELVRQFASAKDSAAAIDILAKAYANLTDQAQRNALVAAIGGRRNVGVGRALDVIDASGGLAGMQAGYEAAGKSFDENLVKKAAELSRQIEEIKKQTAGLYGATFSTAVLDDQKKSAEIWRSIAEYVTTIYKALTTLPPNANNEALPGPAWKILLDRWQGKTPEQPPAPGTAATAAATSSGPAATASVPMPVAAPFGKDKTGAVPASVDLGLMQRWVSLLGDAVTPTEQLRLKVLELTAAQQDNRVSEDQVARALNAFKMAQAVAALAIRERLGLASQEEITSVKLAELEAQRAKGYVRGAEEMATAERIIAREARASAEALQVRASATPQLKQMELDLANFDKQADKLATTSLNDLASGLTDIATGSVNASQGFRNLGNTVVKALTNMAVQLLIVLPLARALNGLLGGGGGAGTIFGVNPFGIALGPSAKASGGEVEAMTPYTVGEMGRELFIPKHDGIIVPNNLVGRQGGGGDPPKIIINNYSSEPVAARRGTQDNRAVYEISVGMQAKAIGEGRLDAAMSRYGVRPTTARR